MVRRVRRIRPSEAEEKPTAEEPKVETPKASTAKPAAKPKAEVTAEAKAKADPNRPEGAPPAEDVATEYKTSTHHVYKLKNHKKVTIPLK